jgi:glutamate dehydrogenase
VRRAVRALAGSAPEVTAAALDDALEQLGAQSDRQVRLAPPGEIARLVALLVRCRVQGGSVLEVQPPDGTGTFPSVLFAVANPPPRGFIMQITEVMDALNLGIRRSLAMSATVDGQRYFLASFRVEHRAGEPIPVDGETFRRLRRQIFATQLLPVESPTYRDFVLKRVATVEEAGLVRAFIGFSHTSCAHNQADRYTHEDVVRAFHFHPEMTLRLVKLFRTRFDPEVTDREVRWKRELAEVEHEVAAHNTGHRLLDEFRRSLFRTALLLVKHCLKTNFFVDEKQALAFRLDPAYLDELGPEFTGDLPPERPFRVTFFAGRHGLGYHIGFADIARGGWRTIVATDRDDYVTVANRVFRENYVLAHTQHLKNKDIYEGGSKLVAVLHLPDRSAAPGGRALVLAQLQRAFMNAFLDVFVTEKGKARDPRVVDHYGEDEPIELGPDENMPDTMIEEVAALSVRRGYILGGGVMSSKKVGINHKEFGVTSTGVMAFAEIAMREARGLDIRKDPFSVKLTGGPNGDVAGNGLRLLLERCPGVAIRLVVDGTGVLHDPAGLDRAALGRIVLREDAEGFDPAALHPGGFVLYRNQRRSEGLRELHRRVEMTSSGPKETWVTVDEFHQEFDGLLFRVPADLFIPAGGRPETIDKGNWERFLLPDGKPSAPVIVEGANSFITPEARTHLQQAGVVLLRDASANKCGVISSSYEIIGNLLFAEREFLAHKDEYVRDVLEILEGRAVDEATLLFRRHREEGGRRSFTELSEALSVEINQHKARLFRFFEANPEGHLRAPWRRVLLAHLPRMVRESPTFRLRISKLPGKYRSAILAAELATTMVYRRALEPDFGAALHAYAEGMFPGKGAADEQ